MLWEIYSDSGHEQTVFGEAEAVTNRDAIKLFADQHPEYGMEFRETWDQWVIGKVVFVKSRPAPTARLFEHFEARITTLESRLEEIERRHAQEDTTAMERSEY